MSAYPTKNMKSQGSFSREAIEAQQQSLSKVSRFPFMRFEPQLEAAFEQFRYHRLIKRVPIIGMTGLVLFSVFSILDFYSLPQAVFQVSIPLRLLLICPSIILIMYLAKKVVSASLFMRVYFSVYLIAGGSIVAIIYIAGINKHLLPYDGILLHLVFGYFLMSLPYMLAMYGAGLVSIVYLAISTHLNLPFEQLASNSIFIISLNFIGVIGCYMQERARRFLFLNENLVALAKAKDKKEIASKTRLVATASHDLRQPLHAMHLLIEALNDQLPEGKHKAIVKSLDISIKQLSQLLSTLLDISKLNAGIVQPRIESMNLAEKITAFCQEQALRAKESKLTLRIDGNDAIFVRVDPLLFDRIIRNVMENIFVHADATDVVFSWEKRNDKVRLQLIDNGKGIANEDLKIIFDEFQQTDDSARTGMGLGLTIVKQLAELQGIEYGLSSLLGKGSCFWFDMPLSEQLGTSSIEQLVSITIIKQASSNYPEAWAEQIKAWNYQVTLLPFGLHMSPDHIRKALPQKQQLLIWDACHETDINVVLNTLQTIQSIFQYSLPLLIVTDAANKPLKDYDFIYEIVHPAVRPAKLRLILEHLAKHI